VIAEYYLFRGRPAVLAESPETLNVAAIVALVGGALLAAINGKTGSPIDVALAPALLGLLASVLIYVVARAVEVRLRARTPRPA
jgi:hypothetical protein